MPLPIQQGIREGGIVVVNVSGSEGPIRNLQSQLAIKQIETVTYREGSVDSLVQQALERRSIGRRPDPGVDAEGLRVVANARSDKVHLGMICHDDEVTCPIKAEPIAHHPWRWRRAAIVSAEVVNRADDVVGR